MLWDRKRFKELGRKALKKNYIYAVAICFLAAFIAGESSSSVKLIKKYDATRQEAIKTVNHFTNYSNSQVINDWFNDIILKKEKNKYVGKPFDQVYISIIEDLTANDTIILRQYEANRAFIINGKVYVALGLLIGSLILIAFDILLSNPLIVGKRRFFLENRIEKDMNTPISTVLHSFKKGLYGSAVKTMFFKKLYTFLWMLTIIGGIIKFYEYKAIPYILAENSQLTTKEVFRLSKTFMNGYKWKFFLLDVSFIPWMILESMTLGIAGILFVVPYIASTKTEAYIAIRNEAVMHKKIYCENFSNPLFDEDIQEYL